MTTNSTTQFFYAVEAFTNANLSTLKTDINNFIQTLQSDADNNYQVFPVQAYCCNGDHVAILPYTKVVINTVSEP